MNTYFVFWKKADGEITDLQGRSVQASDVSLSDGRLKFWREVDNMASDNLVFSLPVNVLVDFHKAEPMEANKPAGQPPKIDCNFVNWLSPDNDLSQKVAELALKIEGIERQKALDEREKGLTFSLFELNEQRLNEEARKKSDRGNKLHG